MRHLPGHAPGAGAAAAGLARKRAAPAGAASLCALLALAAATAPPASAAPAPIDEPTLARRADAIVLGTVADAFAAWNEEHTLIYTHYTIAVADTIAGKTAETVRLRIAGGRVGDVIVHASHAPVMAAGDEVVLFLKAGPETPSTGRYFLCGADAGAIRVEDGKIEATGEALSDFKTRVRDLAGQGRDQ